MLSSAAYFASAWARLASDKPEESREVVSEARRTMGVDGADAAGVDEDGLVPVVDREKEAALFGLRK